MNLLLKAILIAPLLLLSACTIVDGGAIITGEKRAAISIEEVRIYSVAPEKYEEIAIISASAGHDFKSNSALIESSILRLKEEAANLGANGVLLSEIDERDASKSTIYMGNTQAASSTVYANTMSVNRGDSYTRIRGLAIFVKN